MNYNKESVCHHCPLRTPSCHSGCEKYAKERIERSAKNHQIKKEKYKSYLYTHLEIKRQSFGA